MVRVYDRFGCIVSSCVQAAGADPDTDPGYMLYGDDATLEIPWTADLQAQFGAAPFVQAWQNNNTGGANMVTLPVNIDALPPNVQLVTVYLPGGSGFVVYGGNAHGETEVIETTDEDSVIVEWTALRQGKFGAFPLIQVWEKTDGGGARLVTTPIECDAPPPSTGFITVQLSGNPSLIFIK